MKLWALVPILTFAACSPSDTAEPQVLSYDRIEAIALDEELISIRAFVSGTASQDDAIRYAECAAAQFTLFKGAPFARHLRTTVAEHNGQLIADRVYTISRSVPLGARKMDAEVTMAACREAGIPTV